MPNPTRRAFLWTVLLGVVWSGAAASQQTGERVHLTGSEAQAQFLAGGEVQVEASVEDDVFAAGGHVLFRGAKADHAVAAGGEIEFVESAAQDLILAGDEISVGGSVADDLVAAGRILRLTDNGRIGDSAWLAGERLDIAGHIQGALTAAARRITLRGDIAGDTSLTAEEIVLAPGARIGGSLMYSSPEAAEIAAEAVVVGEVQRVGTEDGMPFVAPAWAGAAGWLVFVLGLAVLAAVTQAAMPGLIAGAERRALARPWASLATGAVLLVAGPVAVVLLGATLIGLPLGIVVLALYGVALGLALVGAAWWLGPLDGAPARPRGSGATVWPAPAMDPRWIAGAVARLYGPLHWRLARPSCAAPRPRRLGAAPLEPARTRYRLGHVVAREESIRRLFPGARP